MHLSGKQVWSGLATLVVLAVVGGGAAYYGEVQQERQEQQALSTAKLSLTQAIDKATAVAGGQAVSAKLKFKEGQLVYKVAIVRGERRSVVKIDAQTGTSIGTEYEDDDGLGKLFGLRVNS